MYRLTDPIHLVKGVGPSTVDYFHRSNINTILDLLLWIPLRYEDRTQKASIAQIKNSPPLQEFINVHGTIVRSSQFFYKGKSIQEATLVDESEEKITAMWFNQTYLLKKLTVGKTFLFSGKLAQKGKKVFLTQPTIEDLNNNSAHSQRLVPIYSTIEGIPPRKLRTLMKQVIDDLDISSIDSVSQFFSSHKELEISPLNSALKIIHFPEEETSVAKAYNRLALQELIELITYSQHIKERWKENKLALKLSQVKKGIDFFIPENLPFSLTLSQIKVLKEIFTDISTETPMNRLLVGDVGSGKTIVAGIAMAATVRSGCHACLIAPTQLVAQQHFETLQKFFPNIQSVLITSSQQRIDKTFQTSQNIPSFFIGTHSILNIFSKEHDTKIGLVVFDEQHRFGVAQRAQVDQLKISPHILTMTATPIPRSLMLTIFSHLSFSQLTELPSNRIPTKTKIVAITKKQIMLDWLKQKMTDNKHQFLTLYVCPFIDPSNSEAMENVASVKNIYDELRKNPIAKDINISILHGKLNKKDKQAVVNQLFHGEIDLLVTTPIVEVGIDLPQASAIIIENPERFGLASLHQLRGRVGRAGQQGYCFLLTKNILQRSTRLEKFASILRGDKLAELDLSERGAGDLFGVQQHGFDQLRFANWENLQLIQAAKEFTELSNLKMNESELFLKLNRLEHNISPN